MGRTELDRINPTMNATLRLRTTYRNQGLGFFPLFLAWFVGSLFAAADTPHPVLAMVVLGTVPLLMAGFSVLMVLAYWQQVLTIEGEHLTYQGVFHFKEINLADVTVARWRNWPGHDGSLVLRTDATRLVIDFSNYDTDQREPIVALVRSVLPPEIQVGWNLFSYRIERQAKRAGQTKPGPDEILLRRDRWDRLFGPALVLMGLVGIAFWWITAKPGYLALPVAPLIFWAMMRFSTPAEGMIAGKVRLPKEPETIRNIGFILTWMLLGFGGLAVNAYLRPGVAELDPILVVGLLVWIGVLGVEAFRDSRRQSRRDREAADLAAKGRGERDVDPWELE